MPAGVAGADRQSTPLRRPLSATSWPGDDRKNSPSSKTGLLIARFAVESLERPTVAARRDRPEPVREIPVY